MLNQEEILSTIKLLVKEEIPYALYLFGIRATGKVHEESNWDVLILTSTTCRSKMKYQIHDKLFPLSVEIASFINLIVANIEDWQKSPSYYVLRNSKKDESIPI